MPYTYPTNRELQTLVPDKIARLSENRLGFQVMPMRNVNAAIIQWQQRDNYFGLQQLRGLDGAPLHVKQVGNNLYTYNPGVYGEFMTVDEVELTLRAGSVTSEVPIPVGDIVMERQDQLIARELDRIEYMIWTLLSTGTFSVAGPGGVVMYTDTFTIQTATRSVSWATSATAVPTQDFRAVQLLGAGKGVSFGAGATAYMNRVTANTLLNNTNTSDLFGRRTGGGNTFNTFRDLDSFNASNDLPRLAIYDEGYYSDATTFTRFIPNSKVVIIGQRAGGERIGEYVKTLNANNPGRAPGSYSFVIDRANAVNGEKRVPPNMEVHQGHSGGVILYYPGSVVVLST